MGIMRNKKIMVFFFVSLAVVACTGTMQEDEKECAAQLTNLASCIPFVSGTASKPAPQCCQDTQKVKDSRPKCLCVLIIESTDPSMGLPVNTTLALQMPSACNIDAKVSDCPSLLKLPADSPDAKIFKDAADPGASASSSSNSSSSSSGSGSNSDSKATPSSNNVAKIKLHGSLTSLVIIASIAWMFI